MLDTHCIARIPTTNENVEVAIALLMCVLEINV